MKNKTLITKLLTLVGIMLLLLVGLKVIGNIVDDRQRYRAEATEGVAQSLAGEQIVLGPLVHYACVETWDALEQVNNVSSTVTQRREFSIVNSPDQLTIIGDTRMESLARSLHKVNVFTLNAQIAGSWAEGIKPPTLPKTPPLAKNWNVQCEPPVLMFAVDDARGIRSAQLRLNGKPYKLSAGTNYVAFPKGLHVRLPEVILASAQPLKVELELSLVGTEQLSIVPLGDTSQVQLSGQWPHPSFGGRFLPATREVSSKGFNATWKLSALATTATQSVAEGKPICRSSSYQMRQGACTDSFSVSFIDPVNPYSLSNRAVKYGLLFILLTFVAVGMFEVLQRLRIHPVQYLLIGSALCVFFLLLVSLSEHLSFSLAYAIAASACAVLLGYYACHALASVKRGIPFGVGIAVLYGLLFILLQLEQTALVIGALTLFLVLTLVMVMTRNVNWYGLSGQVDTED